MKKVFSIFLFLFLLNMLAIAQENKTLKEFKHHLQIDIGGHYNYKFGQKYYPPEPTNYNNMSFGGYKLLFVPGIQGGLSYRISYKRFYATLGIQYFSRDLKISSNRDSVIKYTPPSMLNDYGLILIKNRYNNIELPVKLGVEFKRFFVEAGFSVILFSEITGYGITVDNIKETMTKHLKWNKTPHTFYPDVRFGYKINQKIIPLYVYLGADYATKSKYFYFSLGLYIVLFK